MAQMELRYSSQSRHQWYLKINPKRRIFRGRVYRFLKRAIDLTVILMVAPLIVPLVVLIAALIYIDSPGPIVFRQMRTGKGGRRFAMYKFRSMVPNAEELKKTYMHLNELTWPDFKITNDPRITRVGKILRKTSLDELPQLWNVLTGDMTVVGPRPTSFASDTYSLWHTKRLEATPGLTGLSQVCGRSALQFNDRLKLDIAYIERQCLWMDTQIVLRTIGEVFIAHGE